MRLSLEKIRSKVLDWLDEDGSDYWAPSGNFGRLDQLLNDSYQHVVQLLDRKPHPWMAVAENAGETTGLITFTTVPTQREYPIPNCRLVLDVRIPGTDGRWLQIDPCDYDKRDGAGRAGYYVFRSLSGTFYVGSVVTAPPWTTFQVMFRPTLTPLENTKDVPVQVPDEHHELIVYRTALLCHTSEDREAPQQAKQLAYFYNEALARLEAGTSHLSNPHTARRLG